MAVKRQLTAILLIMSLITTNMVLYYRNNEADSGIFKEFNEHKEEMTFPPNGNRYNPLDIPDVPGKVSEAGAHRELIEERLDNLSREPGQLCGGSLEYENHSSTYILDSGGSIHISLKKLTINGSLTISDGTDVLMENVTIYFNFAGTDPYITVIDGSSLTFRNVTVDSDIPIRLYGFDSNITMENSIINQVTGNSVTLGKMTMNNSYITNLEETFTIDRSLFELWEGHINGSSTGIVRFVDSVFFISNSAVSNINGLNTRSTSSGEIKNSTFYRNKNAIFSDGLFKMSEILTIHNTSFLGNERDLIQFQIGLRVSDCIFANSTDKTIGDSDGRRGENREVDRDRARASIIMDDNIFYNNTFLEFANVNLNTSGNIYYESRQGYDIFDCTVSMNEETFYIENNLGAQVNDFRYSEAILKELTFNNWYSPISGFNSPINATGSTFDNCQKGFDLTIKEPDIEIFLSYCTFSNCITPISIDGSGGIVDIEKLAVRDCTHAVDIYYSDVNFHDAIIVTEGWNFRTQHALVNALNITIDLSKTIIGTDSTLNILLEMELLLEDYSSKSLPGVSIDVEEIGEGPSYILKSDANGIVKMRLINITKEESGTTYYNIYRIYHESEQWGYLQEEVNILHGEFLILKIGFSDLALTSFQQSCEDPYHGMDMTTTVLVKNLDLMPAYNSTVYFYIDLNVKEQRSIPVLEYDESIEMIFEWKAFQGGQMLSLLIDPMNKIYESNETNNYHEEFVQVIPEPEKPSAQLSMSLNKVLLGESVIFNASGSTTGTPEIQYQYYFGDGNNTGWVDESEVVHTYNQTGMFFPFCKVRDGYDRVSYNSSNLTLEVMEPPPPPKRPISHIAPPFFTTEFISVESLITFSPVGSYSPDGTEIVKYTWDFGDGEIFESSDSNATPHKFQDDMNYTVSLVVTDSRDLDSLPATIQIQVLNLPPKAVAVRNPSSVQEGEKVTFKSVGTTDPDDDPITELRYEWIFPNGTIISGKMISKIFDEPGDFKITFRVTDDDNASDIQYLNVVVIKGERGPEKNNGSGENEGMIAASWDFIIDYWLWSVCVLVVLLFALIIFIRTRFQSKKSRFRKLINEQKNLEDKIREKEVKKSYREAEKKIKKRILSGDRIDFTINDSEVPTYDDDIDYYGLDNVVEYDGNMGIGGAGDIVEHSDYEEDEYYDVEEYVEMDEVDHYPGDYHDGDYDDDGEETDEVDFEDDYNEEDDLVMESDEVEDYQDADYFEEDDTGEETDEVDFQTDYDEDDDPEMESNEVEDYEDEDYEEYQRRMDTEELGETDEHEDESDTTDFDMTEKNDENNSIGDHHYEFRVENSVVAKTGKTDMKHAEENDDDWNWTED